MHYVGRYKKKHFRVHKRNLDKVPEDFTVFTNMDSAIFYNQKTKKINKNFIAYIELKTPNDFEKFRNRANMNIHLLFGMYAT